MSSIQSKEKNNRGLGHNAAFRRILLILLDLGLLLVAVMLAMFARFDGQIAPKDVELMKHAVLWIVPVYFLFCAGGGVYRVMWRYANANALFRLGLCCAASGLVTLLINAAMPESFSVSRWLLALVCVFQFCLIAMSRYAWKVLLELLRGRNLDEEAIQRGSRKLLIVGAGSSGAWIAAQCRQRHYGTPVCMVDDDPGKQGLMVEGTQVEGKIEDIPALAAQKHVDEIILAIGSLKGNRLAQVATLCTSTGCRVSKAVATDEIDSEGRSKTSMLRQLNTADLLSRDEIVLDTGKIGLYLNGATVLVTGGGGSIGSEICRQVMRFKPKKLVIFDIYENCAYELLYELHQLYGRDIPVEVRIGSVREKSRLDEIMEHYRPDVIFHAAAHKHVPLMEDSPAEAVKNNVFGTLNTMRSASEHGVKRFVILSTDKAVNPTNVMGATKRITEMIIQTLGIATQMKCMAVRFGNVLGSHGSVIPLFENQIRNGGPVTITHPDITRYFMTIPEAAQLVLQAGSNETSGTIYVLDMGEPVRIVELAKQLIQFYGYVPGKDIQIKTVGLRPGEKLYEELLMDEETNAMGKTAHNKIFVAPPLKMDSQAFAAQLVRLDKACHSHDDRKVVETIAEMVTTFHPDARWHITPPAKAEDEAKNA